MPASMMLPDLAAITTTSAVRSAALADWQASGWPGPRAEAWRFTRLAALDDRQFVQSGDLAELPSGGAADAAAGIGAHVLRFVNGVIDPAGMASLPSGIAMSRLEGDEDAMMRLRELAPAGHPVSNLSLAVMSAGILIDVTGHVDTPLMLVFEGTGADLSAHPVVLLQLADGAQLQLAEWHETSVGLAAPLMGCDIAAGARLEQVKLQVESGATTHLSATGVALGEGASIDGFALSVGGSCHGWKRMLPLPERGRIASFRPSTWDVVSSIRISPPIWTMPCQTAHRTRSSAVFLMTVHVASIRGAFMSPPMHRKPMASRWRGRCCSRARQRWMPSPSWKSMLMMWSVRMAPRSVNWMQPSFSI